MKVCILSNSHAAALQLGWQAMAESERSGFTPQFFASRQSRLKHLKAKQGGHLVCANADVRSDLEFTSGGDSSVDLGAYDAVVVHALGLRMYYDAFQGQTVSQAFLREWIKWRWEQSVSGHLLTQIRQVSEVPVVLSVQPYWSEEDAELRRLAQHTAMPLVPISKQMAAYAAGQFAKTYVLEQPATTVIDEVFTKARFATCSQRLDVGDSQSARAHPADDYQHMNAEYGVAVLGDLRALLERKLDFAIS